MTIEAHITTCVLPETVEEHLNSLGVPFERSGKLVWFDIPDVEKQAALFQELSAFWDALPPSADGRAGKPSAPYSIKYARSFSEEDLLAAEYLSIRSSFFCFSIINDDTVIQRQCCVGKVPRCSGSHHWIDLYRHFVQVEPAVTARKKVPWSAERCFGTTESLYPALFCNDRAKTIIEAAGLQGAHFGPVMQNNGAPLADAWQLCPEEVNGFLAAGAGVATFPCEGCGRMMFEIETPGSLYEFLVNRHRIPPELDFFQSGPVVAGREFPVISQRAYSILKANRLLRAVVLTPLRCIG